MIRKHPHVCIEPECDVETIPSAESPSKYSSPFASVTGCSTAELVSVGQEKIRGLNIKHQTGQASEFSESMTEKVEIIKETLMEFTAKAKRIDQ